MSTILPRVDIVVIAYNEERNIRNCVDAILRQSFQGTLAVTIVDDASTDNTWRLIGEIMRRDSRVYAVRHPTNQGRGKARISGIRHTKSEFLGFVDADIIIPPNWLQVCVEALSDAGGSGGLAVPDGDVAVIARISGASPRIVRGSRALTGNNFLVRRQILDEFPYPLTSLGEDFRYFTNLDRNGIRLRAISDLVVEHREDKSYRRAILWLFVSGVDAASLFREFRDMRTPDRAARVAGASVIVSVLLSVFSPWTLLLPVLVIVAIALAHTHSRFSFVRTPLRTTVAFLLDIPLIGAYLLGRARGAVKRPRIDRGF